MKDVQDALLRACATLALLAVFTGLGYWWGAEATANAWRAKDATRLAAQLQAHQAEAQRAAKAAAEHQARERSMEERYATLERTHHDLLRRQPLAVAQRRACGPAVRPGPAAGGHGLVDAAPAASATGSEQAATAPGSVEPPADELDDGGGEPRLTLAAVRLWNGSLTGADTPAGACGAAGAPGGPDAACAADSGLSLADAWANHHANAKSCAEDRQRYRDLIDYLNNTTAGP